MTAPRFTPGPWSVDARPMRGFDATVTAPGSKPDTRLLVASFYDVQGFGGDSQANAQLAASAPALYAALERVEWRGHDGCCPACYGEMEHAPLCKLAAALAAARGGQ